MKITSMDVRAHQLKRSFRGYDARDVDALKELCADALEDASREIMNLEERLKRSAVILGEHTANETTLKDAITTAQKMVEGLLGNARKEAELTVAEAKVQAENIVRQAHTRAGQLQEEIYRLKKQRIELEIAIKAVIEYHSSTLVLNEEDVKKADAEAEKLKFFKK